MKPINIIPKTLDEAIQVANEIERYEGVLKQLKEALKKYVEANGAVSTGEKIWDNLPVVSWSVPDPRLVAEKLFDKGVNPWVFVDMDIKTILRNGVLTEQELLQYGVKQKQSKRFVGKKFDVLTTAGENDNSENVA